MPSSPHSHPRTICVPHPRAGSNSHRRHSRGNAAQSVSPSATVHTATHLHARRRSPPAKAAFAEPRTPAKADRHRYKPSKRRQLHRCAPEYRPRKQSSSLLLHPPQSPSNKFPAEIYHSSKTLPTTANTHDTRRKICRPLPHPEKSPSLPENPPAAQPPPRPAHPQARPRSNPFYREVDWKFALGTKAENQILAIAARLACRSRNCSFLPAAGSTNSLRRNRICEVAATLRRRDTHCDRSPQSCVGR